jgi:drug/metabolite transporter (DMT)-like permease
MGGRFGRTDLLVLCVVLIWAATFSVIKFGLREIAPLPFATVRFTVAALLLVAWVWLQEGAPVISRGDWVRVSIVGLTVIGMYQALFTLGIDYTTASNSSLMLASIPAWTALFAVVSRQERLTRLQTAGIILSFFGVALAIRGRGEGLVLTSQSVRGDLMTLIAAALYGFGAVVSKPLLSRYSSLRMMSIAIVCGSVFLILISWPQIIEQDWASVSLASWLGLAFTAVFGAGLAFVIWFKSIGEIGASRTSVYNNLIPPVAIVIAFLTLGETFTALQLVGGVVVLAGVSLTRFSRTVNAPTA